VSTASALALPATAGIRARTTNWLGHRDFATTLIYADYQPSAREADLVDDALRGAETAARAIVDADAVA
jgi:hypothetical protein